MPPVPTVRVSRKGADRVASGHPWIFASDVLDHGSALPGDVVRVVDFKARLLGTAHFSSSSKIALRFLSRHAETIDEDFLLKRIESAYAYRRRVVSGSDAYRLIHAEGDRLPGLIVDRYGDWLSLQILDQGMDRLTTEVVAACTRALEPRGIVARNDVASRAQENLPQEARILAGTVPEYVEIHMNELILQADLLMGQKTGVFLDQRENYVAARRYSRGRALDCFTGTGGFALHVASVCESVQGVDSSAKALQIAKSNAATNGLSNIDFLEVNVLEYLPALSGGNRKLDVVVVDPPAFAKSRSAVEQAARAYKEINLRALRLLKTGGILVSCSCSHHMSEANFLGIIAAAALDCKKELRVLERRAQSQDHPILLAVPETHYLKCLIFEVL